MITIVHGEDIVSSRKYFVDQKDENSLTFDGETLMLIELNQSLSGSSLFGSSKKIFIDNLFSKKASKNFDSITELLSKKQKNTEVYIWSDKALSVKQLSLFPKADAKLFKIPQNIWSFLDGIKPGNVSNVSMFHNALSTSQPEIIFTMIIRQFRLMIGLSESFNNNIDEIKRLAPWQKSKLMRQASLFGIDSLKQIYKKLYKIEKQQKTGSSNLSLVQNIDILLLEI